MKRGLVGAVIISLGGMIAHANSLHDVVEQLARGDESTATITHHADGVARIRSSSLQDMDHQEILDGLRTQSTITREQFAYLLNLVTHDVEAIRDIDRCGFRDYEDAESILGLAAVNTLCHKGIVRGTYQQKFYYQANLTHAEAVTMIVRAKFLERYDSLLTLQREAPASQWYLPYYELAREHNMLGNTTANTAPLRTMSPGAALELLVHNFGSVDAGVSQHPLSSIIYQTIHDDERAHIVWRVRDVQGHDIHIADDSVRISLDPYREMMDDTDIFVSDTCDQTLDCLTKIEFSIRREENRSRYCGTMQYTIDSPYQKEVEEYFCLDK